MKILLIVGLGNPSVKYQKTRHNAGFMFADYFFEKFRDEFEFSNWEFSKKMNAEISLGKIREDKKSHLKLSPYGESLRSTGKIILMKPQTFMNLSGKAVATAAKYYKLKLENVIVAHDDIDLALGKYKISKNSSSAGHNGVQSIIDLLGTKNFTRLRIGVDNREDKKIATEKYVLGKFTAAEMKVISKIMPSVSDELIF